MEKQKIEDESIRLLNKTEYQGEEVDVIKIAKRLGFQVGIAPLDDGEDGFIVVDKTKKAIRQLTGLEVDKIIGVNSERDLKTKRFIIAHEIGHFYLHYKEEENDGMYAHRENKKGKDENENDADFFAACLLMPKEFFMEKYNSFKKKELSKSEIIMLLENHFNVPRESVARRIDELEA